jgi:hypothetical protein
MSLQHSERLSEHRLHAGGVTSRYAPQLLLLATFFLIGLGLALLGIQNPQNNALLPGVIAMGASLLLLIAPVVGWFRRARSAEVYSDHLAWTDAAGRHECRWDEITEVYRVERITNRTFRYTLLRLVVADGRQAQFDHTLSDYDALANQIQQRTAELLSPAKRQALEGAGAEFGPVTLSRGGIALSGEHFPWEEIDQYTIFNGSLIVFPRTYKGHAGKELALSQVPNYALLLLFLRELRGDPMAPNLSILFQGRGHK